MRREEDEQCGNESMWKRRRTMDQEREQELSCLQQVELEIDGGMRNGIECINHVYAECRTEFPCIFQVMGPGKNLLMKSEEGSQKTGIHRALNEERRARWGSLFNVQDYYFNNFKFNRRCWI